MESNGTIRYRFRNKKNKIYMDWSHTEKRMRKYQRPPYYGTLKEAGKQEDLGIAGEDRLSKKWEVGVMN
jgi:hypothetical protein